MPVIVRTNIPNRIAVEGTVGQGLVLEEIAEGGIAYRPRIDPKVRVWPLVLAEITVDDVMTVVNLSTPVRNERRAPISVLTVWDPPVPGTQAGLLGNKACQVDFTKNIVEVWWTADSGIIMRIGPLSEGVALYLDVKRTPKDVVLVSVSYWGPPIQLDELRKIPPLLRLSWPPGDMPQVWLSPSMFPAGEHSGVVIFARHLSYHVAAERQPARSLFLGYAGQTQWLTHILLATMNRDPQGGGDDPLAIGLPG